MDIFLAHSLADASLAKRLGQRLQQQGLTVELNASEPATSSGEWLQDTVRAADNIVVIFSPRRQADEMERLTWRIVLEALWQDTHKRLIPVLRRGAELPSFVWSSSQSDELEAVALDDAHQLDPAVEAIVQMVRVKREGEAFAVGNKLPALGKLPIAPVLKLSNEEPIAERGARLASIAQSAKLL